ncbi:MAG: 1-acyl-sn-glycerol-3-phosphate acyltransferase [Bradymonadia bacterium]|jgi:1-acyl-sn-glycerol-3-phosphate acyltransferase
MKTLLRRLLVIPLYFIAALVSVLSAPLWIPLFALVDVIGGRTMTTLRCVAYFACYLWIECAGILGSAALWFVQLIERAPRDKRLARLYRLQAWWGHNMVSALGRIFGLTFEHTGQEALHARGPVLVFVRHASTADTMLPLALFGPHRLHLRFVLKKELLFDPCLDLVGNQLPNYFIDRAIGGTQEIAGVAALADNLGPNDGVLLYPEGTRFTPRKRARIIERLREKGEDEAARRAEGLRHVLPPRMGGALALLKACEADVIIMMHSGFDGITSLRHLVDGTLVGRTIRTHFVRFPRASIPDGDHERAVWLHRRWMELDAWLGQYHEATAAEAIAAPIR